MKDNTQNPSSLFREFLDELDIHEAEMERLETEADEIVQEIEQAQSELLPWQRLVREVAQFGHEQAQESVAPIAPTSSCAHCDALVTESDRFCRNCGASRCPSCNGFSPLGNFCTLCGHKLNND